MNQLILGVDSAWTESEPSGIALVSRTDEQPPRLLAVGRSISEFNQGGINSFDTWLNSVSHQKTSVELAVRNTNHKYGKVECISLDIPLSPLPITGRRAADNRISVAYGSRWASTHTPSSSRPGPISDAIFHQLSSLGFRWAGSTQTSSATEAPSFLETYPHPVIVEMMGLEKRLPYKVMRRSKYWPDVVPSERLGKVATEMDALRTALNGKIVGIEKSVPSAVSVLKSGNKGQVKLLKGIEDVLDAITCACVGVRYLDGSCESFGDEFSAIWVPLHS